MVGNIMPSFWLLQRVGGSPGPTRSYILGRPYILYILELFLILMMIKKSQIRLVCSHRMKDYRVACSELEYQYT